MENLAKFYSQGEPVLLIFTKVEEVNKLRVELEESEKQLQNIISMMVAENTDLKGRIRLAEQKITDLERLVREALQQN